MDNIAEGFERGSRKEFIYFLCISKSSNGEVQSQLYRAVDQSYITKAKFQELYALSKEVGNLLAGFIKYLNKTEIKGQKHKK